MKIFIQSMKFRFDMMIHMQLSPLYTPLVLPVTVR